MTTAQDAYTKVKGSGIFHNGGLKGKKLAKAGPIDFQVWPISDIEGLIWELVQDLIGFTQGIRLEAFQYELNNRIKSLLEAFDKASPIIQGFANVKEAELKRTRKKIEHWIATAKAGISKHDPHIPILITDPENPLFYAAPDKRLENEIAFALIKYIPDNVPDLTIAHRVNELLVMFGKKEARIETLRRSIRDYRHCPDEKLKPEHQDLLKKGTDHIQKYVEKLEKQFAKDKE